MLEIRQVDIDRLRPYAANPRVHRAKGVRRLVDSVREFGWTAPILATDDFVVVAGHGRLEAAKKLGRATVPVIVLPFSEDEARAYRIADNRIAEDSSWNPDALASEITDLLNSDVAIGLTFLEDIEIEALVRESQEDAEAFKEKAHREGHAKDERSGAEAMVALTIVLKREQKDRMDEAVAAFREHVGQKLGFTEAVVQIAEAWAGGH